MFVFIFSDTDSDSSLVVHPGEVTLVALILLVWIGAIALFLHKWGKIRILQPSEPRYKHNPKNLDTIKVVKRPTDSVIYRSYPRQLSQTMLAREKRMERMYTMPNIKLSADLLQSTSPKDSPKTEKRKFQPVIEMEEIGADVNQSET